MKHSGKKNKMLDCMSKSCNLFNKATILKKVEMKFEHTDVLLVTILFYSQKEVTITL